MSMGVFINFPYYPIFYAVYSLTGYMHLFGFSAEIYRLDLKLQSACSIEMGILDENRIRGLLRCMMSSNPEVPEHYLLPLLPSSIPGTSMRWSEGVITEIAPPGTSSPWGC
jgi:hypothetical protein